MISNATGRERLVYFIVGYHIVLNLYFIKWIGLKLRVGLNIKSLLVTFFTLEEIRAYLIDIFDTR